MFLWGMLIVLGVLAAGFVAALVLETQAARRRQREWRDGPAARTAHNGQVERKSNERQMLETGAASEAASG